MKRPSKAEMRVSKTKGINPRFPVFQQVHVYENTIGLLLSHVKAHNSAEDRTIKDALSQSANAVFEYQMRALRKLDPGKGTPGQIQFSDTMRALHDEQIRFNDSVSALRTAHARMICRITKANWVSTY